MKKVITIVGARPQFVKAAVVSRAMALGSDLQEVIVHTGQHYDENMSGIFFNELGIRPPDYNLKICGGTHGQMTGKMLEAIESVISLVEPGWVLVYGDTNSTLAAALAAAKLSVPIAHVEAGLRSFNRRMPEEINRVVTDHVSSILFSPTSVASKNLNQEGIRSDRIFEVGDVMYDATLLFREAARAKSRVLESLQLSPGGYVLATVHRQENTDNPDRLEAICKALSKVSGATPVLFLVHPRTAERIRSHGFAELLKNVVTHAPVGYLEMLWLQQHAVVIATDSGGLQKEAFFHRIPCVTLRDETEWVELIDSGWNTLSPPLSAAIADDIFSAIGRSGENIDLYGAGNAAKKIVDVLSRHASL
jgi:UDP-GlcNAc3NAcA epimerase